MTYIFKILFFMFFLNNVFSQSIDTLKIISIYYVADKCHYIIAKEYSTNKITTIISQENKPFDTTYQKVKSGDIICPKLKSFGGVPNASIFCISCSVTIFCYGINNQYAKPYTSEDFNGEYIKKKCIIRY